MAGYPVGTMTEEDREGIGLAFYAVILEKQEGGPGAGGGGERENCGASRGGAC
ncbi:hypothetical protein WME79_33555 [Sorangium sp. So ce726]|uniref:hypothetical protein n=1 Tax=Sorangium sp. So ce726 TaxID=3133319 RepID=UPI003F61096E